MSTSGIITNIQSYSLHDGPGARTVVFLKGCPLKCRWCANPETQHFEIELYRSEIRCMYCKICALSCKNGAVTVADNRIEIDRDKCIKCGACVENCPTEAMTFSGHETTPEEILKEIEKERAYILNSGGGVTFSGGEPLAQSDFLHDAAKLLKDAGYHVAIETCFDVPYENIELCLPYIDLLLVDLKAISPERHKELTGRDNVQILENIKRVYGLKPFIFRIPIIPGQNDISGELEGMAQFISDLDAEARVDLMPYHVLGRVKYENLGRDYGLNETPVPDKDYMNNVLQVFLNQGLNAEIV